MGASKAGDLSKSGSAMYCSDGFLISRPVFLIVGTESRRVPKPRPSHQGLIALSLTQWQCVNVGSSSRTRSHANGELMCRFNLQMLPYQ